jgi:hypothetical protein
MVELLYLQAQKYFIIIIIIILLQLGVHPMAVELTLIQTRKVYNIREQYKTEYNTENKVHTAQIQTYRSLKEHVLVFVSLHSNTPLITEKLRALEQPMLRCVFPIMEPPSVSVKLLRL